MRWDLVWSRRAKPGMVWGQQRVRHAGILWGWLPWINAQGMSEWLRRTSAPR